MKDKILFVGGTWDLDGGKPSSIVQKFASTLSNVDVYNGGNYNDLGSILDKVKDYNIVLWWANVPNDLPKVRDVKEINYKTMLVSSKNNTDDRYTFQDLLQRSFALKSNLVIEFKLLDKIYQMRLFDPLGNIWYEGTDIKSCADELIKRLTFIKSIKRESTVSSEENNGALAWFFNMFKQEMYQDGESVVIPIKEDFLRIVKGYATKLAEATFETKDVKRFLGNASFRCPKGFPSFREGKYIFVSRRNINKEYITIDDFVPVYLDDNKIYYHGDFKPSVDTPIQVRLYNKLPNINYMIHTHCYIKDASYTDVALPCGAIEEVDEIINAIKKNYDNDLNRDFYVINLKGHGSIMMSNEPKRLETVEIIGRHLPEVIYESQ